MDNVVHPVFERTRLAPNEQSALDELPESTQGVPLRAASFRT